MPTIETEMSTLSNPMWGLPDPDLQPEFYADVPVKRLVAWVFDMVLIVAATFLLALLSLGIFFFIFPFVAMVVGLIYRWFTIARHSATPGMRLVAIELRSGNGQRLESSTAFFHSLAYTIAATTVVLQLASIVLMLTGSRAQGLHDHLLGTAMINRASDS